MSRGGFFRSMEAAKPASGDHEFLDNRASRSALKLNVLKRVHTCRYR